jgi:hypothetical protein
MKILLCLIFSLTITVTSQGQQFKLPDSLHSIKQGTISVNQISETARLCICCRQRGDTSEMPLLVLNDLASSNRKNEFIINPKNIIDLNILKGIPAIKRFGDKAKYGAILIKTADTLALLGITELLSHFNINNEFRSLPICVDENFVSDPLNILADLTAVKNIIISEGKYWVYTNEIKTSERFINIVTK